MSSSMAVSNRVPPQPYLKQWVSVEITHNSCLAPLHMKSVLKLFSGGHLPESILSPSIPVELSSAFVEFVFIFCRQVIFIIFSCM